MGSCDVPFPHLFLRSLRMENLVQFKDAALSFAQHTEWGLVVRIRRHHHRLALFTLVLLQHWLHSTQHADVPCRQRVQVTTPRRHIAFTVLHLNLFIPLSSTSCSWYFLRSATSFLYFSRRSLLASDISLIAAEICQTTGKDSLAALDVFSYH